MSDDSELDYIRTFLGKVHTAATVKHFSETKSINSQDYSSEGVAITHRILVYPGELMKGNSITYIKRYLIKISEDSEANLMTALKNILIGIGELTRREAITSYTKPDALVGVELFNGIKDFEQAGSESKIWYTDIYLLFEWSVN